MGAHYQVVVVGAGPAGSVAAREAARLGCGAVLLLDRAELPRAKVCAGGLSPRTCRLLGEMGLWRQVAAEAYPIRAARLVSPNGREAVLTGAIQAAVMDRRRFDQILVDAAVRDGVVFRPGTKVDGLLEERGRVTGVRCGCDEIGAGCVVLANGANSSFSRDPRPKLLLHSCMGWFEGVRVMPHTIEIIYERELLPHYGWLFPESDTRANLGVALRADLLASRSIRDVSERFLERYFAERFAGSTQLGGWKGALLSTTLDVQHHAPPGALVVGEANRLTNVATGEGMLYAMLSGRLAAQAIRTGMDRGLDPLETASLYARGLRRQFQRAFDLASLYCRAGVKALDAIVALARAPGANRLLVKLFSRL